MVNVILIPDGENCTWYDWLSTELVKRGHSFFLPQFPSKKEGISAWVEALKDYRKHLGESSIIIGHGAGRVIVLRILEEKLREVSGAFFIPGSSIKSSFKDFSFDDLDFSIIKDKARNFFVYSAEDDDSSSFSESEDLADRLDEEVLVYEGPEHFKKCEKFEDLLIDILSLIEN